jgi:hypothetical protein
MLRDVGHTTSVETVRRYREGLSQRIDSAFLAAVVAAIGVDSAWLLNGPGSPEEVIAQADRRAHHAMGGIALDAAAAYLGPPVDVDWQEEMRQEMATAFVVELLDKLELSVGDVGVRLVRHAKGTALLHQYLQEYGEEEGPVAFLRGSALPRRSDSPDAGENAA